MFFKYIKRAVVLGIKQMEHGTPQNLKTTKRVRNKLNLGNIKKRVVHYAADERVLVKHHETHLVSMLLPKVSQA